MADITERQSLAEFTEKAYLDYSMYVILDRALPHIALLLPYITLPYPS